MYVNAIWPHQNASLYNIVYLPSSNGSDLSSPEMFSILVEPMTTTARSSSSFSAGGGPLINLGTLASSSSSFGIISAIGSLKSAFLLEVVPTGNKLRPVSSM